MKACAVLPAFNEANSISEIIKKIKALGIDAVVVDDGSQDATPLLAKEAGAILIQHSKRCGKGASLKDGFDYVRGKGYDIIITLDSDGQHDPDEIPLFIKRAEETGADVVVGNRLNNPTGMPPIRILTNRLMSSIISSVCRQDIPDTQCGYRLFSAKALNSIKIEARRFEIDSELLVKLARRGYRIESLPIRSIYAGEKSQVNPLTDAFRFIRFLIKTSRKGLI